MIDLSERNRVYSQLMNQRGAHGSKLPVGSKLPGSFFLDSPLPWKVRSSKFVIGRIYSNDEDCQSPYQHYVRVEWCEPVPSSRKLRWFRYRNHSLCSAQCRIVSGIPCVGMSTDRNVRKDSILTVFQGFKDDSRLTSRAQATIKYAIHAVKDHSLDM